MFGGCERDFLRHEDHAKRFYNAIRSKEDYKRKLQALYDDRSVHPELDGRFTIPNDIDVIFTSRRAFSTFQQKLLETCYRGKILQLVHEVRLIGTCNINASENENCGEDSEEDIGDDACDEDEKENCGEDSEEDVCDEDSYMCNLAKGWFLYRQTYILADDMDDIDFSEIKFKVDAIVYQGDFENIRGFKMPFIGKDFACNRLATHMGPLGPTTGVIDDYDHAIDKSKAIQCAISDAINCSATFIGDKLTPSLRNRASKMIAKGFTLCNIGDNTLERVREDECTLCYTEDVALYASTGMKEVCNHAFCIECIRKIHFTRDNTQDDARCPFCRVAWPQLTVKDHLLK